MEKRRANKIQCIEVINFTEESHLLDELGGEAEEMIDSRNKSRALTRSKRKGAVCKVQQTIR